MISHTDVILVDQNDNVIGQAEKMSAHRQGLCHRAFSVFVLKATSQGWEVLLQQRAFEKYHSPGLWTNTCCSHPSPGEGIVAAAQRRLQEEFGFSLPLEKVGVFHYRAPLENGLIEDEIDHVLIGYGQPEQMVPNAEEIADYRWWPLDELQSALSQKPEMFTVWLKPALTIIHDYVVIPAKTGIQRKKPGSLPSQG